MVERLILAGVALAAVAAAWVWGRSARRLLWVARRVASTSGMASEPAELTRGAFLKDVHTSGLYALVALFLAYLAAVGDGWAAWGAVLLLAPAAVSIRALHQLERHARLSDSRAQLEQRAEQVLSQEDLAPRLWAARLAPEEAPVFPGFDLGSLYQAGTGMMAGDFYDVVNVGTSRVAAVIGDVTGRGIEASITAFQAKYLLRVFLRQYRDPGQALEELNAQLSALGRGEELISLVVVVFDTEHHTLRFASAGHPAAWLWHDRDVKPLRATGPLLMLAPDNQYHSREIPLEKGDLLLLYTDGLAEVRNGEQMFGEERIANALRRDPNVAADVLCKNLLESARDFASEAMSDDVAILAIRRS